MLATVPLPVSVMACHACSTGAARGPAADTLARALCTGLEQLKAVYAEGEAAGISLGVDPAQHQ